MNYLTFEIFKISSRKWMIILLLANIVLLPLIVAILVKLEFSSGEISEGNFLENAAYGIISISTIYFFVPLWILIFIGIEFSNGHTNLVVFHKSFKFYFISKIAYCFLVSLFYCILGLFSLLIIHLTAPFKLEASTVFYMSFITQSFFTFFSISLMLMALVFLVGSPIIAFVSYFVISFTESILFLIGKKIYAFDLFFLPFHISRLLYLKNGEGKSENYYVLFYDYHNQILILPVFLLIILYATYWYFIRRDLKPLSD